FWDIPVPKIDSAFDNLFVPQPSWSPSTTQQLRKLVAAPYLAPNDWTPRSEAYFVFPLAQGTPGKQCGLAATGVYQPSLRSPWLAAIEPTSQHGLDKYPPHVPTIYKNTHLASIEQTVYGPYQGFGRHQFSRVTDTRNQAGQQGQGHRLFLSPDHPGQADPALASCQVPIDHRFSF
ncbi:hypothetical protein, partial [Thiolapillus sp.]|uniref:hypothetical protein n=1 Tax=Thiolapillus sp. TaxID=2017437 RepID=UPI003AF9A64E